MFKSLHRVIKEISPYSFIFSISSMSGFGFLTFFSPIIQIFGRPLSVGIGVLLGMCFYLLIKKVFNIQMCVKNTVLSCNLTNTQLLFIKNQTHNISSYKANCTQAVLCGVPMETNQDGTMPLKSFSSK